MFSCHTSFVFIRQYSLSYLTFTCLNLDPYANQNIKAHIHENISNRQKHVKDTVVSDPTVEDWNSAPFESQAWSCPDLCHFVIITPNFKSSISSILIFFLVVL